MATDVKEESAEKQSSLESLFGSINVDISENEMANVQYDYVTSEENKESVLKNDFARIGSA